MIRVNITLLMVIVMMTRISAEEFKFPFDLTKVERIIWLTPTHSKEKQFEYVAVEVSKDLKSELINVFLRAKVVQKISYYLLDSQTPDQGFLVFVVPGRGEFALRVFGAVNKKNSANDCKLFKMEKGEFRAQLQSLSSGLETSGNYREIIKKIPIPKKPKSSDLYILKE